MKKTLLIAIFLLGFFLRAQETLSGNFLFLKDQGRDLLAVKSIVIDKKPTLIGPYTGLQAVFQGPLYYYTLAIPFAFSGGDPRAIMWLMLAVSMAAIYVGYLVGKTFFSAEVGLATAFLFAVSPAAAAAATFIWSPFFVLPLSTLCLYFLLRWIKNGHKKSFLLLAGSLGLLFHFEIAFAAPFTITTLLIAWFIARKKRFSFPFISFIGILILFLSPLILFDFRHDFLTTKSLLKFFSGVNQGLGGGELYSKVVYDHFVRFLLNLKATFIVEGQLGETFSFLMILAGLGYVAIGRSLIIKTLASIPLIMFVIYLAYPFQIWDWYLIGLFPVYLTLGGIFLNSLRKTWYGRVIFLLIIGSFLLSSIRRLDGLYRVPDYGGTAKIRGKIDAIDTMYLDAQGNPFNLLVFTPVVLTDAYDYLLWWHGQKTYGYLPGKEKAGTLYLLIEPDPSKPWSYQGWLETVIKEGKVIDTRELPSGFIIQKRTI